MSTNKDTTSGIGFFKYFKNIIGWHIYGYIISNLLVGLLDGLGLAMFIPLLAIATNSDVGNESLGQLQVVVDFIEKLGLELNLITALSFMIGLFILKSIIYFLRSLYMSKIRLYVMRKIRFELVSKLKNLSYQGFTILESGKIQNNMVGESGRLVGAMGTYLNSIQHAVMLLTYVSLAFLSNWKFAIMVGIGGVFTNIFYNHINKITKEYSRKQVFIGHDFNGFLIQAINNFKYLKATNRFINYEKKLKENILKSEEITYKIGKIGAFAESLREPTIIIVIASVILIQVHILEGSFTSILASLLLFYRSLAHLVTLQNTWNGFIGSSASLESIEDLKSNLDTYAESENKTAIPGITHIEVKDIEMIYNNRKVIDNISFTIPTNKSIAFVGESGAGKTTLANIICGLQAPVKGDIIINNQSLYHSNLESFRDKVGYITQESVIFDDTVFNNVTFWDEKTPENLEKFRHTMELVSMKSFLEDLELKEDTPLGNNGILISGGQKQRISIARELYRDVELLIMDEATSALDSETEKYIKENIDTLQGKCTMVIIAHRLSTIKNVDTIYLLDKGKILDSGNFSELINKSERFKKMVELQEV